MNKTLKNLLIVSGIISILLIGFGYFYRNFIYLPSREDALEERRQELETAKWYQRELLQICFAGVDDLYIADWDLVCKQFKDGKNCNSLPGYLADTIRERRSKAIDECIKRNETY